ncbi:MAG: hypothetical protein AABZ06_07000 [Bdellovibrionota bacterium]
MNANRILRCFPLIAGLLLGLLSSSSFAITWDLIGIAPKPIATGIKEVDLHQTVAVITVDLLKEITAIHFKADEKGIAELNGLKSETYSNVAEGWIKVTGWCYSINSSLGTNYANEAYFTSQQDHLRWFYGYAYFTDGKWVGYCLPWVNKNSRN